MPDGEVVVGAALAAEQPDRALGEVDDLVAGDHGRGDGAVEVRRGRPVVDGVAGVEVQTEKVWDIANSYNLPRAILVNKLDRERSSFDRALASVQSFFGRTAIPVQLPLGAERDFKGVIDVVQMKA